MAMDERLRKVQNLPLHRYLGIGEITSGEGRASFSVIAGEAILNPAGMLHGGVVYLLCDVCAYAGLLSILDARSEAVTHDLHVSVMRAVGLGEKVTFQSAIVKMGKTLCFIDVTASVAGKPIAAARVTKSLILIG